MSTTSTAAASVASESALPRQRWCIVTCEYPPLPGGVSDHTFLLAQALVRAGDTVDVWMPPAIRPPLETPGVRVHVLPSLFKPGALRILHRELHAQPPDVRILVQYVPTGYGWRMMNLPFALLLFGLRKRGLDVYVHEIGFLISTRERWRRNVAAVVHLMMNWFVMHAAARVFVAIPEWQRRLEPVGVRPNDRQRVVQWVPVPSNVPDMTDPERVRAIRGALLTAGSRHIVGHFGTFGRYHTALLIPTFARILDADASRVVLLVGRGSAVFRATFVAQRPDLAPRIFATGGLEPAEVSAHLEAADVLLQPYDDGISARRGSLMAALALGKAVVSNRGRVTGGVWRRRRSVLLARSSDAQGLADAVSTLLANPALRAELGAAAQKLHREDFALERGVQVLRGAVRDGSPAAPSTSERTGTGRPRVLMLHTTLPTPGRKPGGVEVAVHRLANALVDLDVPITVASLSDAPLDARYEHRRLFELAPWLRESRFGRLVVLPVLLNAISTSGFDVVHYHGDDWFVLRRPLATVRTVHGSALREAQRATRLRRRLAQYLVYPLERIAARLATISIGVGSDAASIHGLEHVIGNGVDAAQFHPGQKSPTPMVLYVGTWDGRKRGRWMYEQFIEQIAPRRPDVELRFISDRPPPPHAQVRYEHFPDDASLARAFREAWVFALPSTYEGFGIPYLEAMASGTAVVATPNTGAHDLLGNGRFGRLVDDDGFADAVLELLSNDAERARLADAGIARSREFGWPEIARAYLGIYELAIAKHRAAAGVR